ncbi:hypothetical protein D6C79_05640 [Aureobasidium pullulans]|nr:hypothetical protein D6C79_05640 [Aureobasidium pullulans]
MLTPTYVNLKSFFYPIGNTPAANLLRDYRPHDAVKILAIGCGDVRNILFTLWSNQEAECTFDFTACDSDPAVLARNVFLLTAVACNAESAPPKQTEHIERLWRAYYHFYVTSTDLAFIQEHARQLYTASESLPTWNQSPFGAYLKFTTEATLTEVRRIWLSYAQTRSSQEDSESRHAINLVFDTHYNTSESRPSIVGHGVRSAGAHGLWATPQLNDAFHAFWRTGVVAGNRKDVSALSQDGGGRVNPLMAISPVPSSKFNVHYGSDPLLGFHLAEHFDLASQAADVGMESLALLVKSQFSKWCQTFISCVASRAINIMHHCGEAINFAHALQAIKGSDTLSPLTRHYVKPWSAVPLSLPSTLFTAYHVIDTSNVIDHVGILSLLPAIVPLLSEVCGSVLYTESLLQGAEESQNFLSTVLHSDVTMSSLVFGVAPVGYLLGTMTDSTHIEHLLEMSLVKGRQKQYRMRLPWRRAAQGDLEVLKLMHGSGGSASYRLNMDPHELAAYFMQVYLAMFRESEDISIKLEVLKRMMTTPLINDLGFCSRLSLVALLATAKRTIFTDWKVCIGELVSMIENNRSLMISSNSLQELYLHLHASDLWSAETFMVEPRAQLNPWGRMRPPGESGLLGKHNLPAIVHIALVVPRRSLVVFTEQPVEKVGTPGLHLSLSNGMKFENCFYAIDTFFGKLEEIDDKAQVFEDHQGWAGEADLIVTCPVPTWSLLLDRRKDLNISLSVNTSPATMQYTKKLGVLMRVFTANLESKHVHVLAHAPSSELGRNDGNLHSNHRATLSTEIAPPISAAVALQRDGTVQCIKVTKNYATGSRESKALKDGATVAILQVSPCVLMATIGDLQSPKGVVLPFPVDGAACKIRIARKSSWIEISAPTSNALQPGGFKHDSFPVVSHGGSVMAWGMGRVNPDLQPQVMASISTLAFLQPLFSMALSERERTCVNHIPPLIQAKEVIRQMCLGSVGLHPDSPGNKVRLFMLKDESTYQFFIIANALRHDRDTGSVFLDAFYMPATRDLIALKSFQAILSPNINHHSLVINADAEDIKLWQSLIPALVERCRSWEHVENCTWKTNPSKASICDCGLGKDVSKMSSDFRDIARFATRIAIPAMSAVPYLESMTSQESMDRLTDEMQTASLEQRQQQQPLIPSSNAPNASNMDVCGHCRTIKPGLKACTRCEKVKYCNHTCQKAAWKTHKKECKR